MSIQTEVSTPMDEIQRRLFAVLGGADPAEVKPLVEQQLAATEREMGQIPQRAQARGPEFAQHVGPRMETLLGQLGHYQTWLRALKAGLDLDDRGALVGAYEDAQTLIPELVAALQEYTHAFGTYGPYQTAAANSLSRMAEGVQAGQVPADDWTQNTQALMTAIAQKREAVRSASLPGRSRVSQAYQRATDRLRELAAGSDLQGLDEALAEAERIERMIAAGLEGPTQIPAANVLIAMIHKAVQGEVDVATVGSFLDDYFIILDQFWEGFESSLTRPPESALVQDEIPRTLEYGDQHSVALEALDAAVKAEDKAAMAAVVDRLIATAGQLQESREVFESAAQHQGASLCPGCGRSNPPENRRCEACGTALPIPEEGAGNQSSLFNMMSGPALEETQRMEMTENVAKIFQACDDVAVGKISDQQFLEVLKEAHEGLKDFTRDMGEIGEEIANEADMDDEMKPVWRDQHAPYVQELGMVFEQGVQDVERGLLEMEAFLGDRNDQHLVDGIRITWEALGTIHRAQLAMNSNLRMLEDVLEEGIEKGILSGET